MKILLATLLLSSVLFSTQSCESSRSAAYGYESDSFSTDHYMSDNDGRLFEEKSVIRMEDGIAPGVYIEKKPPVSEQKKIIYNARMSLTVKQVDTVSKKIEAIAEQYKGYISESGTERMVIRVEAPYLDSALAAIGTLGRVDSRKVSGQDVTGEFFDLQIRVENAERARARYLELLSKAENVQAALLVEKELERLNNEIDFLKGRMNTISTLSTYSTITINLKEKTKLGPIGLITVGLYRGVKWLFVRG